MNMLASSESREISKMWFFNAQATIQATATPETTGQALPTTETAGQATTTPETTGQAVPTTETAGQSTLPTETTGQTVPTTETAGQTTLPTETTIPAIAEGQDLDADPCGRSGKLNLTPDLWNVSRVDDYMEQHPSLRNFTIMVSLLFVYVL